jgi:hypothetical protein
MPHALLIERERVSESESESKSEMECVMRSRGREGRREGGREGEREKREDVLYVCVCLDVEARLSFFHSFFLLSLSL